MKYFCFVLIIILFTSCSSKKQTNFSAKTASKLSDTAIAKSNSDFSQFVLNDKGIIIDSFMSTQNWFKHIVTNKEQNFPAGFAAYQQKLFDSLLYGCKFKKDFCQKFFSSENQDTFYCEKKVSIIPEFKSTDGVSYFNNNNTNNYYFFLAMLDTNKIYFADANYGLFYFLKLKTQKQKLKYIIKHGKEEFVNDCNYQEIVWEKPIDVYFFHESKSLKSSFYRWKELWECGQKDDYAPDYPFTDILPIKNVFYNFEEENEFELKMNNPYLLCGYVAFDEHTNELKSVNAKPYSMQLVTNEGRIVKGNGIDFNNDQHADLFWCNQIQEIGPSFYERITLLYKKVNKNWIPVYGLVFNEFTGYGYYYH